MRACYARRVLTCSLALLPSRRSFVFPSLMVSLTRLALQSLVVVALAGAFPIRGAFAQDAGEDVQQKMTPQEFKAAGLDKLSANELQSLNKWLNGYRETTVKTAKKTAERQAAEVSESRVDGTFNGIGGGTVIRLEDGTVWKQANPDEHWRAPGLDHPAAVVVRTAFGRKMRIAGTPEFYVDPVR